MEKDTPSMRPSVLAMIWYIVPGIIWVLASDWVVALVLPDPSAAFPIGTIKGLLFVFVTGGIMYALLAKQRAAHDRIAAAYRETERGFRLLFMNNPLPVWAFDRETLLFLEINDVALAKYGYTRDELLRTRVTDLHVPEDLPDLLRAIATPREVREISGQWRHRRKDGSIIEVETQVHDLEFRQRPARVVVAVDVTERTRALHLERQRAARARALAEAALAMNMAAHTDDVLRVAADAALSILGTAVAETYLADVGAGRGSLIMVSARDGTGAEQDSVCVLQNEQVRQEVGQGNRVVRINATPSGDDPAAPLATTDGRCRLAAPLVGQTGENLGVIQVACTDHASHPDGFTDEDEAVLTQLAQMTSVAAERVRLFQQGIEREQRFRELVEGLEAIVWEADPATQRFTYVSNRAEVILGYPRDAWTGESDLLAVCLSAEHRALVCGYLSSLTAGEAPIPCEVRAVAADGRTVLLRLDGAAHAGEDGTITHLRGLITDVTGEREREERVARGEKLRALGQLSSGVAHDLNQTLGLITGYGELLQQALDEESLAVEHLREMADVMVRAAADGGETVRRMLQFIRTPRDDAAAKVDLGAVMHEVVRLTAPRWRDAIQAEGSSIDLTLEIDGEVAINGSAASLREALTNLMLNAVDALPSGGEINLSVRSVGDRAEVVVADSGIGMTDEVRERIFEPFFTTKGDRGTGLGLPTVYGIVEAHRGDISVRSGVGRGTIFTLTFPLAPTEHAGAADDRPLPHALEEAEPSRLRCLVVDDEPQLARMLATMLGRLGHECTLAYNGDEALEKLAETPVDVLVTDVGMGPSMNGWELAERALALRPTLPIVLATGWGASIDLADARARGIVAVLSKPFRSAHIKEALERVREQRLRQETTGVTPAPVT